MFTQSENPQGIGTNMIKTTISKFAATMLILALMFLGGISSFGAPVYFDFGDSTNSAVETGWTGFEVDYGGEAVPISQASSGVTVTVTSASNTPLGRDRSTPFVHTTGGSFSLFDVYRDFVIRPTGLTISGLTIGTDYTVEFIMFDDDETTETVTQTVTDTTGGGSNVLGNISWNASTQLSSDSDQRVVGSGLFADGSGNMTFTISAVGNGGNPLINGLVLYETTIPEPASMILLALGGLAVFRRRANA